MGERNGIAYAVFDASLDEVENWNVTVRSRVPPMQGATLMELAVEMGVDAQEFNRTIDAYNAACPSSDGFDPLVLDGLSTTSVAKSQLGWPIVSTIRAGL